MNLFFLVLAGAICAALVFGCGGAPAAKPVPPLDGPTPTSAARDESETGSEPAAGAAEEFQARVTTQIRVTRYEVAEGSVERVSAGTEIIAEEGIVISGTLRVDGTVDGDFVLTAETGDIVISGSVIVETPRRPGATMVFGWSPTGVGALPGAIQASTRCSRPILVRAYRSS